MWLIEGYVRERVQGKQVPKGKKNTKYLENRPQGSLTKQKGLLQGKGFFTENKKGRQTLRKRLGRSTDCGRKSGKCYGSCSI